jgi:hypothetical protein
VWRNHELIDYENHSSCMLGSFAFVLDLVLCSNQLAGLGRSQRRTPH